MRNENYNGWANWETWNFSLWINSDQETYDAIRWMAKDRSIRKIKKELKLYCEDLRKDINKDSRFFADVMDKSICMINFTQIAEHLYDEINEYS